MEKSDEVIALEGINALADFIKELGLPTSLKGIRSTEQGTAQGDSRFVRDLTGKLQTAHP